MFGHGQFFDKVEPSVLLAAFHGLKGHVERHEFGHRRRRQRLIRVFGQQHGAGGLVQHIGGGGAGIEGGGRLERQHQRHGGSKKADHRKHFLRFVSSTRRRRR